MTDAGESKLPLQYEDGPDYCTVRDAQGRDFALTVQPDLMKAMEKALHDEVADFMRPPADSPVFAIHDALTKANLEYSGYSCNGVNLFGDRKSIDAAARAFHSHGQIDSLQTNLRHWREECGKLHAKLKAQKEVEHALEYEIEGVILRRLHNSRVQGYTLEMAKELAALYFAFRPDKVLAATPTEEAASTAGGGQVAAPACLPSSR